MSENTPLASGSFEDFPKCTVSTSVLTSKFLIQMCAQCFNGLGELVMPLRRQPTGDNIVTGDNTILTKGPA